MRISDWSSYVCSSDLNGFDNVQLVAGNVFDTIPDFLENNPAQKIALLHLDLDVFEPTAFSLEKLLPRMVRGGLVVFDDYTLVEGATRAADEMCEGLGVKITKLPNYCIPAFFTELGRAHACTPVTNA